MSERPTEPYVQPREPTYEEGPSSMLLGFGLFALFLVLFAGVVGVDRVAPLPARVDNCFELFGHCAFPKISSNHAPTSSIR